MIAAIVLAAYAGAVATFAPRVLTRLNMADRAPRLFIGLWQAASVSVILSVILAGIAATFPSVTLHDGISHLLNACVTAIREQYEAPARLVAAVAGVAVVGYVLLRLALVSVPYLVSARSGRRRHVDTVTLVGRPLRELGVTVIAHREAAAYCVPGRHGKIVLTTTALENLDSTELAAVLAHERAHMRGRHHLVLDASAALARAFPFAAVFSQAHVESLRLVEMLADDAAVRSASRTAVATALVRLGAGPTPAVALAAGGSTAAVRVRRMLRPARPLSRSLAVGVAVIGVLVIGAPVAIAAVPAVTAHHVDLCPPGSTGR